MPVVAMPPAVIGTAPPLALMEYICCTTLVLDGVKSNCRLHVAPAARVAVQLVAEANGAVTEPSVSVMDVFLPLVRTTPKAADVVPTGTVPQLCPSEVRVTLPVTAVPDPVSVPPLLGTKVVPGPVPLTCQVADTLPAAVGAKVKSAWQCAPTARDAGQLVAEVNSVEPVIVMP